LERTPCAREVQSNRPVTERPAAKKMERKTGRLKVGIIMIKCPQTGRAIPTGIKADRESFQCSAVFFARTHCSICQTNHDWFAKEAWVYEPSVE
jgi:hypothetical protein